MRLKGSPADELLCGERTGTGFGRVGRTLHAQIHHTPSRTASFS
jgi:hypothetical protein